MPLFLLLFIGLPLIELYILIQVGAEIGAFSTILLSVLTAVLGAWLVRHQGFSVLRRVRELLDRHELPAIEVVDGALLLVAGLCLLLPGFVTDSFGFMLLIPPLRRILIIRVLGVRPVPAPPPDRARADLHIRVIEGECRRDH